MVESAFTVTFGGPTTGDERIPVRALAPALLALGELLADASVLVDPDREPAMLSIDSIQAASPEVRLSVAIDDDQSRLTDLLTTDPATVLTSVLDVVIGPLGLLQLTRQARNRSVLDQQPKAAASVVRVTLEDGEELEARTEAVELYLDRGARRHATAVAGPLLRSRLETLELASPAVPPVVITKLDTDAFELPPLAGPPMVEQGVEMLVDVAAPAFPVNNKWRLSNGIAGSFWATIGDGAFLNRVNAGEPFRKGDSLRCLFTITQTEHPLGTQTEYHVTRVLEHIARGEQLRLDVAA